MVMFFSICLSTLFVYGATTGTMTTQALDMWILNSLFFSSAVFSVKLRKKKTSSLKAGVFYQGIAASIVVHSVTLYLITGVATALLQEAFVHIVF